MHKTLQRFFEPLGKVKILTGKVTGAAIIWALWSTFLIYTNKQIAVAAEAWNAWMINERVVYFLICAATMYTSVTLFEKHYDTIFWELQRLLYKRHLKETIALDNNSFELIGTWYFNSVFQRGVDKWADLLAMYCKQWVPWFLEMSLSFVLIYMGAWWKGVGLTLLGFILSWVAMIIWAKISYQRRLNKRKEYSLMDRQIVKIIMSKFEVLQNNQIDAENKKIDQGYDNIIAYNEHDRRGVVISYIIPRILIDVLRGAVYFYVWLWVIQGTYTIADFVLLISIIELFKSSMISLISIYRRTIKERVYVKRLRDKFDTLPRIEWLENWNMFSYEQWTIEIKNLSYQYSQMDVVDTLESWTLKSTQAENVFTDFNLSLEWGKKTAFVWVSGSWKSTLIKLIAWYLTPTSGSVSVDAQDLSEINLHSYYKHIWYLTQDPSIFDGTVLENLTYATEWNSCEEKLQDALKKAQCDFVFDLPKDIHTEIGERGVRLSWGQRQRLAIAKLLLKDPSIIILDEPTSALDSFSEDGITKAMHTLFEWRTVLIIAHRLQTVKEADDIIVLDAGTVVERGTHAWLLKKKWVYAQMLELQSGF